MIKSRVNYNKKINLVLIFFIMSLIGWIFEMVYHYIRYFNITDRGFLFSPIIPIYGFGCILVLLTLNKYKKKPLKHFFMIMLVCGILEYLTSYFLELIFNKRWWNYFKYPFNINGRVCLYGLLLFGIVGHILVYYFIPFINKKLNKININNRKIVSLVLIIIISIDFTLSVINHLGKV